MAAGKQVGQAKVVWHGASLTKKLQKHNKNNIRKATAFLEAQVKREVGKGRTRTMGPSKPGDPPHVDTGTLRKTIFRKISLGGLSGIVGTPLKYGLFLELGTSRMAPRPYLRATLDMNKSVITGILTTPM